MSVTLDRSAAGTQNLSERARQLLTLKNLHIAGVAVLGVVCVYLLAHMAYAWQTAKSQDAGALAQQRIVMQQAEVASRPLAGLDEKLKLATVEADAFYERRLPFADSAVAGELGLLAARHGVKLTRVQYAYAPELEGTKGELTELRMDASLTGDYRPLVLFINALERDKMFFLIRGVALVGQQGGTVGVRLGLTTYLRAPVGAESSDKSVTTSASDASASEGSGAR